MVRGPAVAACRAIDEDRFNALPDDVFLDWRRRGWLALAYAHLMSMRRWQGLANLFEPEAALRF